MSDDNHKGAVERALDVFVYAPLGAALLARDTVPGLLQALATRGRAELDSRKQETASKVEQAKAVGRFALDYGAPKVKRRVEERITDVRGRAEQSFTGLAVRRDDGPPAPAHQPLVVPGADATVDTGSRHQPDRATAPPHAAPQPHEAAGTSRHAGAGGVDLAQPGAPANGRVGLTTVTADTAGLVDEVIHRDLSIPDYDELSASQVVQRLPGLSVEELEAIRAYETRGRGRRTILGKIDQLVR